MLSAVSLLRLLQLAACLLLAWNNVSADAAVDENLNFLNGITIPPEIAAPSGNVPHAAFKAAGHQHYTFNGTQWVLKNASAKLYGSKNGAVVGRHFFLAKPDAGGGQPTWQTFDHPHHPTVTSTVTAKGIATVSVDAKSIVWNLLQATNHSGNTEEPFGHVTYVQRLETRQGLPPSTTTGISVGATHASKYYATYAFYVAST